MNPQWLRNIGHAIWNRVLRVTATSFLLYASLSTAFPQALTSLSGDVTDATGALVPNVAITLEEKSRGLTRSTTSDAVGLYTFPQIPPGKYRLVAKTPGFAEVVVENLELQVNTPATVNLELRQIAGRGQERERVLAGLVERPDGAEHPAAVPQQPASDEVGHRLGGQRDRRPGHGQLLGVSRRSTRSVMSSVLSKDTMFWELGFPRSMISA